MPMYLPHYEQLPQILLMLLLGSFCDNVYNFGLTVNPWSNHYLWSDHNWDQKFDKLLVVTSLIWHLIIYLSNGIRLFRQPAIVISDQIHFWLKLFELLPIRSWINYLKSEISLIILPIISLTPWVTLVCIIGKLHKLALIRSLMN